MNWLLSSPEDFTIIGENIHATRIVLLKGKRVVTLESGQEAVVFKDGSGRIRHLSIPESFKTEQPYQQGQVKHFMIAVKKGMSNDLAQQTGGKEYIAFEARRQTAAGAHYLDLNVDEVSYDLEIQKKAMRWLVKTIQEISSIPPSIDSSNADIIAVGLAEYDGRNGRPMINSVALERLETLDLVKKFNGKVIITAAGADGMPNNTEERVENVSQVMEAVQLHNIPINDVFIDGLVFPIAVDPQYGLHYLNAVRSLRKNFGSKIHLTGGLSNVSFGLPNRRLINQTFTYLSLEAGIDSGIVDPVQSSLKEIFNLDTKLKGVGMARDMLLGEDEFCVNYIRSWREGNL